MSESSQVLVSQSVVTFSFAWGFLLFTYNSRSRELCNCTPHAASRSKLRIKRGSIRL